MRYELTEKISDDISMNHAIIANMEDIQRLQNTIKLQQKLIENLSARVDVLNLILSEKTVTIESRL